MNGILKTIWISCFFLATTFHPVYAYVGPGGAVSGIGAFVALVAAVLFAIFGFLWYPIKRLFRRKDKTEHLEETLMEKNSSDNDPGAQQAEKESSEQ